MNPSNEQGTLSMQQIWSAALERLSGRLSPQNFDMWLRPIEFISSNDTDSTSSVIHVRAPNSYVRLWFESNFLDATVSELRAVSGRDMALVFEPEANAPARRAEDLPPVEPGLVPRPAGLLVGGGQLLTLGEAADLQIVVPEPPHADAHPSRVLDGIA